MTITYRDTVQPVTSEHGLMGGSNASRVVSGASRGFAGLSPGLWLAESRLLPDWLIRWGIRRLLADGVAARRRADAAHVAADQARMIAMMSEGPIAVHTQAANEQHYELPPSFFGLVLGPHRKYSGCLWEAGTTTLEEAEAASLRATCEHAQLADGQQILELGCGWGSLTLWMAEHYPKATITAVSNSRPQREYIMSQATIRGLHNVRVVTADMNDYAPDDTFDRVVSVEMFEHMRNWKELFCRITGWLRPSGMLLLHIFVHRDRPYFFETGGQVNWLSDYFFTGGVMPSDRLPLYLSGEGLTLQEQWKQDGTHYQRTANAWLENLDRHHDDVLRLMRQTYGPHVAALWLQRWRMFFMACAEMWGYQRGSEWWVSHYRFGKVG